MGQEQFFQSFFIPNGMQQQPQPLQQYIVENEMIMEIANNWEFAYELMVKYKEGSLQQVIVLEKSWLDFLLGKNIDITLFKNEEEFISANWKLSS